MWLLRGRLPAWALLLVASAARLVERLLEAAELRDGVEVRPLVVGAVGLAAVLLPADALRP